MSGRFDRESMGKMKSMFIFFALLLTVSMSSCGISTNKPEIKISSPQTGMTSGDVTISVTVANFELVKGVVAGHDFGKGHIIYYMDVPVPVYYEHSAASKAGTYAISNEAFHTWQGVTPGEHTFSVQLVKDDDTPLPVPVIDRMTTFVGPPDGNPGIQILYPADGSSLPPGNIAMAVKVNNFIVSREGMGVVNREGEGHMIYYMDEVPPVDAGIPATTDTSVVSSASDHLWRDVKEGKHTFSVQLVNNDDTPLDTPIVIVSTMDIKP
jgi:hypothetical protein